jgi:hypothetical protein
VIDAIIALDGFSRNEGLTARHQIAEKAPQIDIIQLGPQMLEGSKGQVSDALSCWHGEGIIYGNVLRLRRICAEFCVYEK